MKTLSCFAIMATIFVLSSCGGGSGSDSGSSSSGGGSGGGSSSGFQVTGKLSSAQVSSSISKGSLLGTITNILAVQPGAGGTSCKIASVDSANAFTLGIDGKKPWLVYFIDSTLSGSSMFMGRLLSSTMDTLLPASTTGSLDLGTLSVNASSGQVSSSKSYSEIVSGLGLDDETANFIGNLDDIARRYANPDTDGDGNVDCASNQNFLFDFHVRFNMTVNGSVLRVGDIVDNFPSDSAVATYTGTGIYAAYPSSFSSVDTGSVTFQDSAITTSEGGYIPANTATSAITTNNFGDYRGFGPNTTSTSELPSGTIVFSFGGKTLTFSDVRTPALADIIAPTGRIFPFVKFIKSDSGCTSSCTLSGVGYKWMKKTSSGWTTATTTELDLIADDDGGYLSFRYNNDSNKTVSFAIPKTSASGTINWSSATLSGVSSSELSGITTNQICHIGLSYDDKLGMRYFEGIYDADGTCS